MIFESCEGPEDWRSAVIVLYKGKRESNECYRYQVVESVKIFKMVEFCIS